MRWRPEWCGYLAKRHAPDASLDPGAATPQDKGMFVRLQTSVVEKPWGRTDIPADFGDFSGRRIGEIWFAHPDGADAPIMVKFLFTSERLSVQVHPDDEYAAQHHGGSRGKTEAWHVLAAAPQATVGLGLTAPLTRAQGEAAALSGEIERLMDWRPAAAGDTFLVPAGTVHALGPGLTLVEVQEQSDVTYRLFDYGRGRELHLQHGFDVADLAPYTLGNDSRHTADAGRTILTHCRYFTMERRTIRGGLAFAPLAPHFHLVIVLDGEGHLAGHAVRPGEVWCVPARSEPFAIASAGGCDVLITYPSVTPTPSFYAAG